MPYRQTAKNIQKSKGKLDSLINVSKPTFEELN